MSRALRLLVPAALLIAAGLTSFTVYEKGDDLGGTWRDNTYPGCACDIPSYLYSFSFEQNPHWTRMFAPWDEILAYLKHCAEKYGIADHIQYGAEVTEAAFDESAGRWTVTVNGSETVSARAVVAGVGNLHQAKLPDIPGLSTFAGTAFHSSRWNHEHDLERLLGQAEDQRYLVRDGASPDLGQRLVHLLDLVPAVDRGSLGCVGCLEPELETDVEHCRGVEEVRRDERLASFQ